MLIIYLILHFAATLLLVQGIRIAVKHLELKYDVSAILSVAISLIFLCCSIYLSWVSFAYWFMFGGIVSCFHLTLLPESYRDVKTLVLTLVSSFLFWPQSVCFTIFTLYYLNNLSK